MRNGSFRIAIPVHISIVKIKIISGNARIYFESLLYLEKECEIEVIVYGNVFDRNKEGVE